ncbi:hypothetical protein [Halalkalibacter flavus]|uniref:hypothetical protein n=1 Tax=Halalkalibacter flavus TaxID=3090668 RepID=UPI002FC7FCFB
MSFRHDTRHLSGQQRAIISQRDKADELRKQESEKKARQGQEVRNNDFATLLTGYLLKLELPEELAEHSYLIRTKLDIPATDPKHRFDKDEVKALIDWLMDNPVKESLELSQYILNVYFKGDN